MFESSTWMKACLVAGTLLIGAYVIFGGTPVTRKKRKKRGTPSDVIPGLANIGNSCFLNALVQSLASCPLFMAWLSSKHTQTVPPLLNTLHSLLKALNNEQGTGGDACAGEVLGALRGHGWVITSEEQDTHELFHVLTSTIEDEILSGAPVPSLLDISWLDVRREETPGEGVALRAAVWRLNTPADALDMKNRVLVKEELNGVLCGHVQDLAHFGLHEKRGGEGSESYGSVEISEGCGGGEVSKRYGCSETSEGYERCSNGEGVPSCDKEGCESHAMLSGQHSDNIKDTHQRGVITNRVSSRNSSREKTGDVEQKSQSMCEISDERPSAIPHKCDNNRNMKHNMTLLKTTKKHPETSGMQGTDNIRRKSRSEHQQDIPFRGYLASQLQCTVCGHKNPAQWSSFESLSLSLPSLPWGEVSLQELLGTYITREQVSGVSCEGCTHMAAMPVKATFTKQLTIGKLPDCLCFHVKRTVWLENGSAIKRRDHVTFPEFLVMDPYTYTTSITTQSQQSAGSQSRLLSEGRGNSLLDNQSITALSQYTTASHTESSPMLYMGPMQCDQLYRLQAVIVHVGDVFCGHFVTYRRGPINSHSKNRWFYTSDLLVREASLEEVRKANAYMILYEKVA